MNVRAAWVDAVSLFVVDSPDRVGGLRELGLYLFPCDVVDPEGAAEVGPAGPPDQRDTFGALVGGVVGVDAAEHVVGPEQGEQAAGTGDTGCPLPTLVAWDRHVVVSCAVCAVTCAPCWAAL